MVLLHLLRFVFGFIVKKYAVIYFGSSCFFRFLLLCFICGQNFFFNDTMLWKTQDKKEAAFLATGVENDNLLILNSFNLFYLFWEGREYFYDKKELLLIIKNSCCLLLFLWLMLSLFSCFNDRNWKRTFFRQSFWTDRCYTFKSVPVFRSVAPYCAAILCAAS